MVAITRAQRNKSSFGLRCQSKAIDAITLVAIYTTRSDKTIVTYMAR